MTWLNEAEVDDMAHRFNRTDTPNLNEAARSLAALKDWTNSNSDGWPYWQKPAKAADKLMTMLEEFQRNQYNAFGQDTDLTDAQLKAALTPIKAFLTRHGANHADVLGNGKARATPGVLTITATVTLEVDVKDWANEYGLTPKEVPADVKSYIQTMLQESSPLIDLKGVK